MAVSDDFFKKITECFYFHLLGILVFCMCMICILAIICVYVEIHALLLDGSD